MQISKAVKSLLSKVIKGIVKLQFQEPWRILPIINGLPKTRILVPGWNINLNLTIKLVESGSKIEMTLRIRSVRLPLNSKTNLNKYST